MPPILAIPSIGGKEKIALIIAGCILSFCAVLGIGTHVYHNFHQEVLQLPKELPETHLPKEQPEPENHNFTLLEGKEEWDRTQLKYHQAMIRTAVDSMDRNATAVAITDYLAAITNAEDQQTTGLIKRYLSWSLNKYPCSQWNLNFRKTVEYKLCHCNYTAAAEIGGSSDKKHRMIGDTCNLSMGASLLIMLFARHGPHIGLNDFRDLYGRSELETGCGPIFDVKADFWKRNPHATEFQKAKFLMKETQNLIRFNRARLIHDKMETILAAMNRMRTIEGSSWLVRLLKALYYGWPTVDDDEADADSEE